VGVLCHTSALIGIKEYVINVERSSYERFSVCVGNLKRVTGLRIDGRNSEKALIKRADFDVDLDFVILKSNQRKSKTWVAAEPELEWNVKSGLWKGVAWCAYGLRDISCATSGGNRCETGVGKVCKLTGLANHLVVSRFLFAGKGKLVPDVHPVTILTVDTLTADFDFNHGDHLFPRAI
jgi:hypothetical protein